MPEDPFKEFKYVPKTSEILEAAFNRANKMAGKVGKKPTHVMRVKKSEIRRIEIAFDYTIDYLAGIVSSVPDLGTLSKFYVDLAQILVDNDLLRKKLGRISGNIKVLDKLKREHISKISAASGLNVIKGIRKQAFGRMKSVLDRLEGDFKYLRTTRKKLKSLPVIHESLPAIVLAGYPNVGKTSCINNLCGSKLKVAQYPFTTKEISIGLFERNFQKIQVIDTPGILDRPMKKRNKIELQAILAIQEIADLMLFLIDPSQHSGFPLPAQLALLDSISRAFSTTPLMVVINKIDVLDAGSLEKMCRKIRNPTGGPIVRYSAKTRKNESEMLEEIDKVLQRRQEVDPGKWKTLKT